jgi:hypothetical protein
VDINKDFDRFINALGTFAEIYEKHLSEFAISAYFKALDRFDICEIEKIFSRAIADPTCAFKFWPKPFELVELLYGGKASDIAEVEAGKVLAAVKRVGGFESVAFDNATTQAVISQGFGGWNKLCDDLRADGEQWFLKDFARIYQAYARQGIEYFGALPGRFELSNSAAGHIEHIRQPVLIGDHDRAKQIAMSSNEHRWTFQIPPRLKAIAGGIGG